MIIYSAAARHVNALHALLTAGFYANPPRIPATPTELHAFLQCKVPNTKPETNTVLNVLAAHILDFLLHTGGKQKMFLARAQS